MPCLALSAVDAFGEREREKRARIEVVELWRRRRHDRAGAWSSRLITPRLNGSSAAGSASRVVLMTPAGGRVRHRDRDVGNADRIGWSAIVILDHDQEDVRGDPAAARVPLKVKSNPPNCLTLSGTAIFSSTVAPVAAVVPFDEDVGAGIDRHRDGAREEIALAARRFDRELARSATACWCRRPTPRSRRRLRLRRQS